MASSAAPSTKTRSAPASAYALTRSTAAASPSTLSASVRAMTTSPEPVGGLDRGAHLAGGLGERDHGLAGHVAAALREDLVLQVQRRGARAGVCLDGALDVQRVAVAGVGVGDEARSGTARVTTPATSAMSAPVT